MEKLCQVFCGLISYLKTVIFFLIIIYRGIPRSDDLKGFHFPVEFFASSRSTLDVIAVFDSSMLLVLNEMTFDIQ